MSLAQSERDELVKAALVVQQRAYAPYSRFRVGAAILTGSGEIIAGANVENASFGLTICAERVAASYAVTSGKAMDSADVEDAVTGQGWRAIAIASRGGVTPCGACRQFLMEFAPGMEVLLVDSQTGKVRSFQQLAELLPGSFVFPSSPE